MLLIGITGGIGSGKTTVCKIFESMGIPTFNADIVSKTIMSTDLKLIAAIKEAFGNEIYSDTDELNRAELASIVFSDQKALNLLNSLVHPAVIQASIEWANAQTGPYALRESALLFESGAYKQCDYNVLVSSPEEIRVERVMKRDDVDEQSVRSRMSKQMKEDEKAKLADFTIVNDEKTALVPQVLKLHEYFLNANEENKK